jgi:hypothetical protein
MHLRLPRQSPTKPNQSQNIQEVFLYDNFSWYFLDRPKMEKTRSGVWISFSGPFPFYVIDRVKAVTQRKIITNFYQENIAKGKLYTVRHFEKENVNWRTVFRAIKQFESGQSYRHSIGAGRPNKFSRGQKLMIVAGVEFSTFSTQILASKNKVHKRTITNTSWVNYFVFYHGDVV